MAGLNVSHIKEFVSNYITMVRIKNRYLVVNILYPDLEFHKRQVNIETPNVLIFNQPTTDDLTSQALLKSLRLEVLNLFGDYGAGAIADSLSVKYLSTATSTFILRVARAHLRIIWAALTLMTAVPVKDGKKCVFRVVRVSGTIRKSEEEVIRRAQEMIEKARRIMINKNSGMSLDANFCSTNKIDKVCENKDIPT
ncbi:Ribonuclease P/MRP protein subunit POP5 [Erysiphe neolycopersici]|uniref:Ribonuclease P/MRP protein subunit POP5 n=1 Tax=Erysiphe neolycopersici TaxID=212602 RepID=A0A420H9Y3_9PEZI|nr:Ribonuclease P/MRP protein subunit POP5 [Erysiphe neolycopersici]